MATNSSPDSSLGLAFREAPDLTVITCAHRDNPYFDTARKSLALARRGDARVEVLLVANSGWEPDERISRDYDQVVRVHEGGLGKARNLGAQRAKGEWITFFDADDMLAADYLANTLRAVKRFSSAAYFFNTAVKIQSDGVALPNWRPALDRVPDSLALRLAHPYTGATLVVRRSVFLAAGGYEWPGYAEDYDLSLRLILNMRLGIPARNPSAIYYYRQHPDTMSGDLKHKIEGVRKVQWHHVTAKGNYSMLLGVLASTIRLALLSR